MRKAVLLLLIAGLVLMSGCVKILVREDIGTSGRSDITMVVEPVNVSVFGWDKKNPCNEFSSNESKYLSGAKCSFDGKREKVTAKFERLKAGGLTITGSRYRFDLVKALKSMNDKQSNQAQTGLPEHKNATQVKQMKDAGLAYDYVVKLPGSIVKQSGGTVQSDGSVKFDILELEAADNPYVESDTSILGLLGGGGQDTKAKTGDIVKPTGENPKGGKATAGSGEQAGGISGGLGKSCSCIPALTGLLAAVGALAARYL